MWQRNCVIQELPCSIKFNIVSICTFSLYEYIRKYEFVRTFEVTEKQLQVQILHNDVLPLRETHAKLNTSTQD